MTTATDPFAPAPIEMWPFDVKTNKDGRITFEAKVLTVARVIQGNTVGLKFREDTTPDGQYTGVIWDIQGPFNEQANKRDPYTGPVPPEGTVVTATLSARQFQKRDGSTGIGRDCQIATMQPGEAAAPAAIAEQATGWGDTSDPDNTPAIPPDYGYAQDARDQSIREESLWRGLCDIPPDMWMEFSREQQQVLVQAAWQTALRLMAPPVRERATQQYAELTAASLKEAPDANS